MLKYYFYDIDSKRAEQVDNFSRGFKPNASEIAVIVSRQASDLCWPNIRVDVYRFADYVLRIGYWGNSYGVSRAERKSHNATFMPPIDLYKKFPELRFLLTPLEIIKCRNLSLTT